jgi:hypothetical protein
MQSSNGIAAGIYRNFIGITSWGIGSAGISGTQKTGVGELRGRTAEG